MARYRVQGPDGAVHVFEGPDNASPAEVEAFAAQTFSKPKGMEHTTSSTQDGKSVPLKDAGLGFVRGGYDVARTLTMPLGFIADKVMGDRVPNTEALITGKLPETRNQQFKRESDADFSILADQTGVDQNSPLFNAFRMGGNVVATSGAGPMLAGGARAAGAGRTVVNALESSGMRTGAAPAGFSGRVTDMATRTGAGAATGAASAGLVDPEQALTGGLIGAAIPGSVAVLGKAGSLAGSALRPAVNNPQLATTAVDKYGIPLTLANVSSNQLVKGSASVMSDLPFIGRMNDTSREAVQRGYNKAVGSTFGANAEKLTPDVMDNAKGKIAAELDRLWNGNALQVDPSLVNSLKDLEARAAKLPKQDGQSLMAEIQDLYSKMVPDANGVLTVPGEVANKFQSHLRKRAESSTGLRNELSDMRKAIIGSFNASVSGADAQALTAARTGYKNFKTVEPLVNGAELGVAGRQPGDVPAALLPNAVLKSYGSAAGTDLGELAQIGSQYVADRVARTGGSTRALVQNSAVGSGLALGGYSNPLAAAAAVPVVAGANKLLTSPGVLRSLLSQNPGAGSQILQILQGGGNSLLRSVPVLGTTRGQ